MEVSTAMVLGVCSGLIVVTLFANWYLNKPIKLELD